MKTIKLTFLSYCVLGLFALTCLATSAIGQVQDLPNLAPFTPEGWSDAIVVSTNTGYNLDDPEIFDDQDVYIDWAVRNESTNAPVQQRFISQLFINNELRAEWFTDSLMPSEVTAVKDWNIGQLPAGNHTLRIEIDANAEIPETAEDDNSYAKSITVTGRNIPPVAPNDDFDNSSRINGAATEFIASNAGASKQSDEPNHAGEPGGKSVWWSWPAPSSGPVYVFVIPLSDLRPLLAVYVGDSVSNLSVIASSKLQSAEDQFCLALFQAQAGTTYRIAVDALDNEEGSFRLNLQLKDGQPPTGPISLAIQLAADDEVELELTGPVGQDYAIEVSNDLVEWQIWTNFNTSTDSVRFKAPEAATLPMRFYRARTQ